MFKHKLIGLLVLAAASLVLTAALPGPASATDEEFCAENPEDPGCQPPNCDLDPEDPRCEEPPNCDFFPEDPRCEMEPPNCDLFPEDPRCDMGCDPEDLRCICDLNPSDPRCEMTCDPGDLDCICDLNPDDPRCDMGCDPDDLRCICDLNPSDPRCEMTCDPEDLDCICDLNPDDPRCDMGCDPEDLRCICDLNPSDPRCMVCDVDVVKTCSVAAPPSSGDDCDSKVLELVFEYTGDECSASNNPQGDKAKCSGIIGGAAPVAVVAKDLSASPSGPVIGIGGSVVLSKGGKEFGSNTEIDVLGSGGLDQELEVHTSCSKPLAVGNQFGSLRLVELVTKDGGRTVATPPADPSSVCTIAAPGPDQECPGDLAQLSFVYLGGSCAAGNNPQEGKAECSGDAGSVEPVRIRVTNDKGDRVFFDSVAADVQLGDMVTAKASNAGKDKLESNSAVEIIDQNGAPLQDLVIHTSCSKPLALGDRFGAVEITGFVSEDGEVIQAGAMVQYQYEVINGGTSTLTNVSVDDDVLGPIAAGLMLAPNSSTTLTKDALVTDGVVNTVLVRATSGEAMCEAEDTAEVIVEEPPVVVGSCDDGKPTQLVFEYTGSGCSGSNNPQEGKASCSGSTGGSPVSPVLIKDTGKATLSPTSGVVPGDMVTIDGDGGDLGSETKVDLVGPSGTEKLAIHTSCSKSLAVGDQFGSLLLKGFTPKP